MDGDAPAAPLQNRNLQSEVPATTREYLQELKPKVLVILGATGAGKSKLAVDLAAHFPIEIINADSMQVYRGLDVLTNKVPVDEQKGVPHHLLGTVSPNVEFTAKEFRDSALPIINDIRSRNCLPVVVGGTNYYIQALVSSFLLDETAEDDIPEDEETNHLLTESAGESFRCDYEYLRAVDPVSADRIHPNNYRKIYQYLNLYARSGVLPSRVYQGKAAEDRTGVVWIVVDHYVDHRVDCMIDAGLLDEVYEIYNAEADYTRGLCQAIGVREFEEFLRVHHSEQLNQKTVNTQDNNLREVLHSSDDNPLKILLTEAISKVKLNTRRLVRRQKRMHTRLQRLFGWNIHYVDSTEALSCKSDDSWTSQVLGPAVKFVESFLDKEETLRESTIGGATAAIERDLWTQYTCKACGDKVLRGANEWEQHKQGRGHRKRILKLRKSRGPGGRIESELEAEVRSCLSRVSG